MVQLLRVLRQAPAMRPGSRNSLRSPFAVQLSLRACLPSTCFNRAESLLEPLSTKTYRQRRAGNLYCLALQ